MLRTVSVLAAGALALGSGMAEGGETKTVKTKLVNVVYVTDPGADTLSGDVRSKESRCEARRTIRLGISIGGHPDSKIRPAGKTRSRKDGSFSMDPAVTPEAGDQWRVFVPGIAWGDGALYVRCRKTSLLLPA